MSRGPVAPRTRFPRLGASALAAVVAATAAAAPADAAGPRDLVDLPAIRALDLRDLEWHETGRQTVSGAVAIRGSWKGPHLVAFTPRFEVVERDLREQATLYLPAGLPAGTTVHPIVFAAHYAPLALTFYPELAELAGSQPVALIVHGEEASDWEDLGASSRDELVGMTLIALTLSNECAPTDYRFGNYLLALAETNLMALTLLERALEGEGLVPGPAGILGYSKEGFAAWFASAVDDRLAVAAPGGWHFEDIVRSLTVEEETWGCEGSIGGVVDGDVLYALRNWLAGSPGGWRARDCFSVDRFAGDLYPSFFLIHGDVGLDGLHDGAYYTPGAETDFLETFDARPFRYDRIPDRGARESDMERDLRLARLAARVLVTGDHASHPKVRVAAAELEADRLSVSAEVDGDPEAARLWWSHSPDRAFDDPGNAPWVAVPLALAGGRWEVSGVSVPSGERIGWYVEAETTVRWSGLDLAQRDASPQRFIGGPPPLSCPGVDMPDCTPFRRGDANTDGSLDIGDAVTVLLYLFSGTPAVLPCADAADVDDGGTLEITDPISLLGYLFLGGPAPPAPLRECATDPTRDPLGCLEHPPCREG